MRGLYVRRYAWQAAAAAVAALFVAAVALAAPLTAGTPVQVADNPLAANATCAPLVAQQTAAGSVNYPDAEVEPYVTVDPTNPLHLVASFQQDRWNDGGSNGLTNVVSNDGGADWRSPRASRSSRMRRCDCGIAGLLQPRDRSRG